MRTDWCSRIGCQERGNPRGRASRLRPLGHVLFPPPKKPGPRLVLHAPGKLEDGQPLPERLHGDVTKSGTLDLPGGTFNVAQLASSEGAGGPDWILDAPGHSEDGHVVPQQFVKDIVCDARKGSILLPAGRFTVFWLKPPGARERRRLSFHAVPEVLLVAPIADGPRWVFDAPGYAEHGKPVPEDYVGQIVCTGTLPRISLPSGAFTVAQQTAAGSEDASWTLDAPGHPQHGQPVPQKFVGSIVRDTRRGTLALPAGDFHVVERPRAAYKTAGPRLPLQRTMSEVWHNASELTSTPLLKRMLTAPCGLRDSVNGSH